jgi:hypothetical protein
MVQGTAPSNTVAGYCLGALLLLGPVATASAQTGAAIVQRAAELREQPSATATSLAALPVQTFVNRLGERQGAWVRVQTLTGAVGWVHLFDLSSAQAPAAAQGTGGSTAASALRGLTGFFAKGSAQAPVAHAPTSTLGIRGLGAEEIARAQPNLSAVSAMETQRQSEAQARQFADRAAWVSVAVDPFPEPPRPAAAPTTSGEIQQ